MAGEHPVPKNPLADEPQVAAELVPLVYDALRKLASAKMARESAGQTLQPTALVHEAWLRLGADHQRNWANRAQFFAAAAEAMRRIIIDRARQRKALRRGGHAEKVSANQTGFDVPDAPLGDADIVLLNDALDTLEARDPRKAAIVKHWYFAGLKLAEVAAVMRISERTVSREWTYARAWLMSEIERLRAEA